MRNPRFLKTFQQCQKQLAQRQITMLNDSEDEGESEKDNETTKVTCKEENNDESSCDDSSKILTDQQQNTLFYKRDKVFDVAMVYSKKDESIHAILNNKNFVPKYEHITSPKVGFISNKFGEGWDKDMDDMSKKYGVVVRRIFSFYKYAAAINFLYSLLVLILIILPEILLRNGDLIEEAVKYDNCTGKGSFNLKIPKLMDQWPSNASSAQADIISQIMTVFKEFFTADNYLANTIIFYSSYSGTSLKFQQTSDFKLPRRTLYVITILLIYIITSVPIIFILVTQFIGRAKMFSMNFCKIVFGAYDMNKRSERTILDSQDFIKKALMELIKTYKAKYQRNNSSDFRIFTRAKRLFVWLLVIGVHVGLILTIKFVTNLDSNNDSKKNDDGAIEKLKGGLRAYAFNLAIFGFYLIFPPIFAKLAATMEDYTSNELANVTTIRSTLLHLFPILWIMFPFGSISNEDSCQCKELVIGKLLYAISVTTFICDLARILVLAPLSTKIRRIYNKRYRPEYSVSSNILTIVYVQANIIAATPYFVLAPMIGTLYFVLFFYVNKVGLKLRHASPPSNTTVTPTAIVVLLVYAVVVICFTQFYLFFFDMSPGNCGFFKHFNSKTRTVDMLINELNLEKNIVVSHTRNLISAGPFFLFISGILSMFLMVMISNAAFHKKRRHLLKAAILENVYDEPPI